MPATLSQINAGLKTALSTISGLRVFDYQPDNVMPPVAYTEIVGINYHNAMSTAYDVDAGVIVIVGSVSDRTGQDLLDGYASHSGSSSIRAALEANKTLGGIVDTLVVKNGLSISQMKMADVRYYTVECRLTIYGT